jgi:hypothetical protein
MIRFLGLLGFELTFGDHVHICRSSVVGHFGFDFELDFLWASRTTFEIYPPIL